MSASSSRSDDRSTSGPTDDSYKWKAFGAIAISFFTMVMSMSMVFVGLSAIADDFGVTLRDAAWVVIAQALTISALMLPMGRMADLIGRKKVHLMGLALFAGGAIFTALSPHFGSFGILILSRVVMAIGNAMGQSVGTAMVISVFPPEERGKAIGSQTTAVAVGGAVGPAVAGPLIQWFGWEAMFWVLIPPIAIAFVAGYFILDEKIVSQTRRGGNARFDWIGAFLSAMTIIIVVILINNPGNEAFLSPIILGGIATAVALGAAFVYWELKIESPMLQLRMFRNLVFTMGITTRFVGFLGTTAVRILMPVYLISLRGLQADTAGYMLFAQAVGMATAAQTAGRLSDRFGERPFTVLGFVILVLSTAMLMVTTVDTAMWFVLVTLILNGLAIGLWNVPNNSTIMGSVPRSTLGVVGAFTNLTRNLGNVFGQAVATAIVASIMVSRGFDIPLSEIASTEGAGDAFMTGWRVAYLMVVVFSGLGLALALVTKPKLAGEEPKDEDG